MDLYLLQRYVEAGDINSVHNVNRGEYLHKANRALVVAFVAAAASAIPYAVSVRLAPEPARQVILVREGSGNERQSDRQHGSTHPAEAGASAEHRPEDRAQGSAKR